MTQNEKGNRFLGGKLLLILINKINASGEVEYHEGFLSFLFFCYG